MNYACHKKMLMMLRKHSEDSIVRVGIITWYDWMNFGTVLQAAALNTVINEMGYECETIQYIPDYSKKSLEDYMLDCIKSIMRNGLRKKKNIVQPENSSRGKNLKFEVFRNQYIKFGKPINKSNLRFTLKTYNAVLYGSDQIWMPWFFKPEMFGKWVCAHKRIAFAPSMGDIHELENVPEKIKRQILTYIKQYQYLSFREKRTGEYLKENYGIESVHVIDPVLLLTKEQWEERCIKTVCNLSHYVLIYLLDESDRIMKTKYIMDIAKKMNRKVLFIVRFPEDGEFDCERIFDIGPGEFIDLIKNADLIYTDSFHGIVFSTIFQKPFIPVERKIGEGRVGQNDRIYSYLEMMGLETHICTFQPETDMERSQRINWSLINLIIENAKNDSYNYLQSSLKSVL